MKRTSSKGKSGKKPDVRRVYFFQEFASTTTAEITSIFSAEQNCTLVGVDLHVVAVSSAGATANAGNVEWQLQATTNTALAYAENADIEESRNVFAHRVEGWTKGGVYAYDITKKYKRKMVKGEGINIQFDANGTEAGNLLLVSGYLYVME